MNNSRFFPKKVVDYLKRIFKKRNVDNELQSLYDAYKFGYNDSMDNEFLRVLQMYNKEQKTPYLATGQSGYFNEYIDKNGLGNLSLDDEVIEDAKNISVFLDVKDFFKKNTPIVYTTLLGTTEFNYASHTFPAAILEEVFKIGYVRKFPIKPLVGEAKEDFYFRLLKHQITTKGLDDDPKKEEILERGKRLISKFCENKNRVYLIRIDDLLDYKTSYGDYMGLREGNLSNEEVKRQIESLPTLRERLNGSRKKWSWEEYGDLYNDPNFTSEFGVAIYKPVPKDKIKYIEVDTKYELMQKRALELGYNIGDELPEIFEDEMVSSYIR